jgi:hypothetical protein
MKRTALAGLVFVFGLTAFAQDGKSELRYSFKKGEKFTYQLQHRVSAKVDKVPEFLQGVISEDPIDVKFEGALDVEVTDVSEDGTAILNGTWRTAKAKGHVFVNDIDFDYDAAKKGDEKPKKKDADDPALPGFGDFQDQLGKMVRQPIKLSADKLGKLTVSEGAGKLGEIESIFRSLNGLMGPLPKDKVGKGDSWKDDVKLGMPGIGGQVELKIRAENKIDSFEKVDGKDCVVIKSKFVVGKIGGDKEEGAGGGDIGAKVKTEGEGDGKTLFSTTEGRTSKSQSSLRIKLTVTIPNPGGGDDLDIKAMVKIETSNALGK